MKRQQTKIIGHSLRSAVKVAAVLLAVLHAAAFAARADDDYEFTEIPLPSPATAFGINNEGLVSGLYTDPTTGDVLGFVLDHGVLTTGIAGPGAVDTLLGPANNEGVVIGNYGDFTEQHAALYDVRRGNWTTLPDLPGMPLNFGDCMNDAGRAVGSAYAGGNINGGTGLGLNWIWDGRHYSFFTIPGASQGAYASGINNRDQICGYYTDSLGNTHGFLKEGPNVTTLDVPGAAATEALSLNAEGVVAGVYFDASFDRHGVVWFHGTPVSVPVALSDAVQNTWFFVNDHGDLAGSYKDASLARHAVIAVRRDGGTHHHHGE
jgi:hypothetical protein